MKTFMMIHFHLMNRSFGELLTAASTSTWAQVIFLPQPSDKGSGMAKEAHLTRPGPEKLHQQGFQIWCILLRHEFPSSRACSCSVLLDGESDSNSASQTTHNSKMRLVFLWGTREKCGHTAALSGWWLSQDSIADVGPCFLGTGPSLSFHPVGLSTVPWLEKAFRVYILDNHQTSAAVIVSYNELSSLRASHRAHDVTGGALETRGEYLTSQSCKQVLSVTHTAKTRELDK
ncbi:uncharacterized protein LOC131384489 [Hylobates moloch]|uniref:uncharacterized protein LOC131384489 n=1 Tax=Hylobates moloch TaxID=81572 RepID=UPI002674635F|nr:uncharacterized protein LOC131384489 [Hylobates moloch]